MILSKVLIDEDTERLWIPEKTMEATLENHRKPKNAKFHAFSFHNTNNGRRHTQRDTGGFVEFNLTLLEGDVIIVLFSFPQKLAVNISRKLSRGSMMSNKDEKTYPWPRLF